MEKDDSTVGYKKTGNIFNLFARTEARE